MQASPLTPFILFIAASSPAAATPLYGIAQSIDGDSLRVGNKEVRLFGIDAPEYDQQCKRDGQDWACGEESADRLSELVTGRDVRCIQVDVDTHGRSVARCNVGATDINRTMVATGYALAFRRYSMDYVSAEESAKAAKRGIWSGTFQMPRDVRHANEPPLTKTGRRSTSIQRVVRSDAHRSDGGSCNIKGNRGRNGWIYHVPGMPYYADTVAEEMFCSEKQAQAAGYRRAKVR